MGKGEPINFHMIMRLWTVDLQPTFVIIIDYKKYSYESF